MKIKLVSVLSIGWFTLCSANAFAKCPDFSGRYEILDDQGDVATSITAQQKACGELNLEFSPMHAASYSRHLVIDGRSAEVIENKNKVIYRYFEFKNNQLEGREWVQIGNILPVNRGSFERIFLDKSGNLHFSNWTTDNEGDETLVKEISARRI